MINSTIEDQQQKQELTAEQQAQEEAAKLRAQTISASTNTTSNSSPTTSAKAATKSTSSPLILATKRMLAAQIECPIFVYGRNINTLSVRWKNWLWLWENYLVANALDEMDDSVNPAFVYKRALEKTNKAEFMLLIVSEAMQVFESHCKRTDTLLVIIEALTKQFTPIRNKLAERCQFGREKKHAGESVNEFVMRLRQAAEYYEFATTFDDELTKQFILGCGMQEVATKVTLKCEKPFTLPELLTYALSIESRDSNLLLMKGDSAQASYQSINQVSRRSENQNRSQGLRG